MFKPNSTVIRLYLKTIWLWGLLLFAVYPALASELSASADRDQIAFNETLTLKIRYEGQTLGELDVSVLNQDWEIIHNQRQSQLSFGGGQDQSFTQWSLTLLPKRKGKLLIPSLHLNGEVSNALEIEVRAAASTATTDQPVFIETELDKQQVYVQEQALLTIRFYTSVMLNNFTATEPEVPGARVIKAKESQYQKTVNGVTYTVVETTWAIFAEKSGDLTIPPLRYSGAIPDPRSPFTNPLFGRSGKQILLRSDTKNLSVRPVPPDLQLPQWLPSKGMSLAQRWSRPVDSLVVGEPVTRSLILSAQGLTGAQLPPLDIAEANGFRLYPDQPTIEDHPGGSGIVGTRIESMAIVPTKPGEITLPPIRVKWWDTVSGQLRETVLEAETLTVAAADIPETPPAATEIPEVKASVSDDGMMASTGQVDFWTGMLALTNVLLLLLAGLFASLWWRGRHSKPVPAAGEDESLSEKQAFESLRQISREGPTAKFRETLLHWARLYWRSETVYRLQQIAQQPGCADLAAEFQRLDAVLFARPGTESAQPGDPAADKAPTRDNSAAQPNIQLIIDRLSEVRKLGKPTPEKAVVGLKPLYPLQGQG